MSTKGKVYLITFLLSFLVSNGFMIYYFFGNIDMFKDYITPIIIDPLADAVLLDSTFVKKEIPEPIIQYSKYYNLKKSINESFKQDLATFNDAQIDSTKDVLIAKVDSLSENHQDFMRKINELHRKNLTKQDSLKLLQEKITSLETSITDLNTQLESKPDPKEAQKDYKNNINYLANTYNMMNEKKVAQLMNAVPDEDVIQIFKRMNQRKVGKVLAAMPRRRANSIVSKLTKKG